MSTSPHPPSPMSLQEPPPSTQDLDNLSCLLLRGFERVPVWRSERSSNESMMEALSTFANRHLDSIPTSSEDMVSQKTHHKGLVTLAQAMVNHLQTLNPPPTLASAWRPFRTCPMEKLQPRPFTAAEGQPQESPGMWSPGFPTKPPSKEAQSGIEEGPHSPAECPPALIFDPQPLLILLPTEKVIHFLGGAQRLLALNQVRAKEVDNRQIELTTLPWGQILGADWLVQVEAQLNLGALGGLPTLERLGTLAHTTPPLDKGARSTLERIWKAVHWCTQVTGAPMWYAPMGAL